jgi:hypothetical protein
MRSPKSRACRDAISISSTIISWRPTICRGVVRGMRGMNRLFQERRPSTCPPGRSHRAGCGGRLRSLFVGFESLTPGNLVSSNKRRTWAATTRP